MNRVENAKNLFTKHGMSRTRFNGIYRKIKQRCITSSCPGYKDYGGRGIICRWNEFKSFKDDMYSSYLRHCKKYGEKNTLIDRIDNNGDYCKENCRWATWKEQNNNKRNNIKITYNKKTLSIAQWSDKTGIKYSTIRQRIFCYGWSINKALTLK